MASIHRWGAPPRLDKLEVTRDVRLGGVATPKGAIVVPLLGSANRDEEAFPNSERFEVTRDRPNHVAFGFGIHFWLGAALARSEARVALEELLALRGIARKPGTEPERIGSFILRACR